MKQTKSYALLKKYRLIKKRDWFNPSVDNYCLLSFIKLMAKSG